MLIVCPHCNFQKEIDPAGLPPEAKRATCPKCRQKFDLFPTDAAAPLAGTAPPIPEPEVSTPPPPPLPDVAAQAPPVVSARPVPPPPLPPQGAMFRPGGAPKASGVPWEDRPGSFFGDLFATFKMAAFSPSEFFSRMPTTGGHGKPLLFALIFGTLGYVFMYGYMAVIGFIFLGQAQGVDLGPMVGVLMVQLVVYMVMSPVMVVMGVYMISAVNHLFLMIFKGAGSGFEATMRTTAYSFAAQAFNVIPGLGMVVGGFWFLVIFIIGLARTHRTGVGRVILAVIVLPFALLFGLAVVIGIIAALVIPALSR